MSTASHWDAIYRDKGEAQTSWFRPHLEESLRLIGTLRLGLDAPIVDVGGGRSSLVDDLLLRGFRDVSVLDVSEAALAQARQRLDANAASAQWIVGDVIEIELPKARYALWHDRAVFHFLTEPGERTRYVAAAARAVRADGYVILSTFALDGPERCSDAPVCRYEAMMLEAMFAPAFEHVVSGRFIHVTPAGHPQPFTHIVLRRRTDAARA
ncbi:MAG: class I SAM-dependent methyltransferase [Dokdonella sp.]